MTKIIHRNEYRVKEKSGKIIGKRLSHVEEQFRFWKNYGKYKKFSNFRHQIYNNRKKEKLLC